MHFVGLLSIQHKWPLLFLELPSPWHLMLPHLFPCLQPLLRSIPTGLSHWFTHLMLEFLKRSVFGSLPRSCFLSLWLWICMSTLWWQLQAQLQTWVLFGAPLCTSTCQLHISTEYLIVQIYCVSSPEALIFSLEFAPSVFPMSATALSFILLPKPEILGSSLTVPSLLPHIPNLPPNPFDSTCKMHIFPSLPF